MIRFYFSKLKILVLGRTARNVYLVTVGNGLNAALGLVAIVLVSRSLGPIQFGLFSLAFGVFMTASKFTDLGLNFALSRFASQNASGNWAPYARHTLLLKLILTVLVTTVGWVVSPALATSTFRNSDLTLLFRLSFLSLVGIMLLDFYTALSQALGKWGQSILIQLGANIFKIVSLVVVLFFWFPAFAGMTGVGEVFGMTAVYVAAPLIGALFGLLLIPRDYLGRIKVTKIQQSQILKFSSWMGVGVLVGALISNLDIFMVGNKLSIYDAGIYSAASRLTSIVLIFSGSLGSVLAVRSASFASKEQLLPFIKKTFLLFLVMIASAVIIWPLAEPIIVYTVGSSFVGSIIIFRILLLATVLSAAQSALSANFFGLDKPHYFAICAPLSLIIIVVSNTFLIPKFGALGAAYTNLINSLFLVVINLFFLRISYGHKSAS